MQIFFPPSKLACAIFNPYGMDLKKSAPNAHEMEI